MSDGRTRRWWPLILGVLLLVATLGVVASQIGAGKMWTAAHISPGQVAELEDLRERFARLFEQGGFERVVSTLDDAARAVPPERWLQVRIGRENEDLELVHEGAVIELSRLDRESESMEIRTTYWGPEKCV